MNYHFFSLKDIKGIFKAEGSLWSPEILYEPKYNKKIKDTIDNNRLLQMGYTGKMLHTAAQLNKAGIVNFSLVYLSGRSLNKLADLYRGTGDEAFEFRFESEQLRLHKLMTEDSPEGIHLINLKWPEITQTIKQQMEQKYMEALSLNQLAELIIICRKNEYARISFSGLFFASNLSITPDKTIGLKYNNKKHEFYIAERSNDELSPHIKVPLYKSFQK